MWVKNTSGKKLYWTFIFHRQLILTNMQSYRRCPPLTKNKKENCQKIRKFFTVGCMFYRVGDWDDLQIGLHVSLYGGFIIQFAGIAPIFLQFNGQRSLPCFLLVLTADIFITEFQMKKSSFGKVFFKLRFAMVYLLCITLNIFFMNIFFSLNSLQSPDWGLLPNFVNHFTHELFDPIWLDFSNKNNKFEVSFREFFHLAFSEPKQVSLWILAKKAHPEV